jgi:hypothetical protein
MSRLVHLPPVAPDGQAFRLATLVRLNERPAPLLIPEIPRFQHREQAEARAATLPGALIVLVDLPKALKEEPWA